MNLSEVIFLPWSTAHPAVECPGPAEVGLFFGGRLKLLVGEPDRLEPRGLVGLDVLLQQLPEIWAEDVPEVALRQLRLVDDVAVDLDRKAGDVALEAPCSPVLLQVDEITEHG